MEKRPLIATHRGTMAGMVTENTIRSTVAALACGTDIVEFDVVRSSDGSFFIFHDGYEKYRLGSSGHLPDMTAAEIAQLSYRRHGEDIEPEGVTALDDLLHTFPDTFFNVDRSWHYWDTLLPELDTFHMEDLLILKCPVSREPFELLQRHAVKYPVIPMVRTVEEVELVASLEGVAIAGFELLADTVSHPFVSSDYLKSLHNTGYLAFLNAINLENRKPLFAEFDDEASLFGDVADGWGTLVDLGADIIQTDWPALLSHYLGRTLPFPRRKD